MRYFGSHDLVRRMDRQGGILISCRMLGSREAENGKTYPDPQRRQGSSQSGRLKEKKKSRITWESYRRLPNEFESEGWMAQQGLWSFAREKRLQDRGALPREEGDVVREYKAVYEENFLSSWLREDLVRKEERGRETRKSEKK